MPPGLANAKLAKAPAPGLTSGANAPQLPGGGGGGWAQLKLTDALVASSLLLLSFARCGLEKHKYHK